MDEDRISDSSPRRNGKGTEGNLENVLCLSSCQSEEPDTLNATELELVWRDLEIRGQGEASTQKLLRETKELRKVEVRGWSKVGGNRNMSREKERHGIRPDQNLFQGVVNTANAH